MTCAEGLKLLDGYFDGELDLRSTLEVEDHLRGCGACSSVMNRNQTLRNVFAAPELRYSAPPELTGAVRAQVAAAFSPQASRELHPKATRRERRAWLQWAPAFALLLICAGLSWQVWTLRQQHVSSSLADEAISEHIRSLLPGHLSDVESTDQHTVKPWFDGKLDFSPPVQNFTAQGFPLVAGRLDYLDHRPVAALVYERRKHMINVFVRPAPGENDREETLTAERGYNALAWTKSGIDYVAVSDLNVTELRQFTAMLRAPDAAPAH
ncbi:MAG TPA: anti-sigma factor [Candidatus Acidoferrales bacterium]|nr:anti-sigma factor [Candidatus Acidoferrales bacterium]